MLGPRCSVPTPLCFVLMPFGSKPDPTGRRPIDFDQLYTSAIAPGIRAAGLDPIRADVEVVGGIIHKPMFERLILCEYAVADLTTANANVFYELGIRHAVRPATTVTIFARHQPLPFDVNFLHSLPYELADDNSLDAARASEIAAVLTRRLRELRELARTQQAPDSPLFQLLGEFKPGALSHQKTDVFRDQVEYSTRLKQRLADARAVRDRHAVDEVRRELGALDDVEAGVAVDLYLTYRAFSDWTAMIELYEAMPVTLQRSILVREQLAFALNRRAGEALDSADRRRALEVLQDVEHQQGASSETCGLIGRAYKDLWQLHDKAGKSLEARGFLRKAIAAYRRGFEVDIRDAYPGVNALTLLDIEGSPESLAQRDALLPVVRYAAQRHASTGTPTYWDHATLIEIAVLSRDASAAESHLSDALPTASEEFAPLTTANNLMLIRAGRSARAEATDWIDPLIAALQAKAGELSRPAGS